MKKTKLFYLCLILTLGYLFPLSASAASLRLGMPCPNGDNTACISGHCGESSATYQSQTLWFCDCGLDLGGSGQMCLDEYGNKGETWECKAGSSAPQQSFGLDYCQKTSAPVEPAIFPVDQKKIRAAESRLGAPILKPPGNPCTGPDECVYKKCEPSDVNGLAFCTCSGAGDCEKEFGPGNWACPAGTPASHNVSYCQDGTNDPHYFATAASIATAKSLTEVTAQGATSAPANQPVKLTVPILNVKIPGLAAWTPQTVTPGGVVSIPYLVDYILALYRYAIILASIIAVVVLMGGGLLYLTAGAIPSNVAKAKEVMFGAVSGLTLILASYMMLNIINPNLVTLKPIQIQTLASKNDELNFLEAVTADHMGGVEQVVPDKVTKTGATNPSQPSGSADDISLLGKLDDISKYQRSLSSIKYIVLHEGTNAANIVNYWRTEATKGRYISSHYNISNDGKTYQLLDEKRVGWHAGNYNDASIGIDLDGSLPDTIDNVGCLKACKAKQKYFTNCSDKATAIQKCGMVRDPRQAQALNRLIREIASRTSVTIDAQHVVAHCAISKPGARQDPRNLDWSILGIDTNAAYALNNGKINCFFAPKHYDDAVKAADKIFGP